MKARLFNLNSSCLLLPVLLATAACNSSGGMDLASGGSVGVGDTGTGTGTGTGAGNSGTQTAGNGTGGASGTGTGSSGTGGTGTTGDTGTSGVSSTTGTQTSSALGQVLVTAGNAALGLGDGVSNLGSAVPGAGVISGVVDAAGNLVSGVGTTVANAGLASNSGAAPGLSSVVQIGAVGQQLTGDAATPGLIGLSVLSPTQDAGTLATIGVVSGGNPLTAIVGPAGSTAPLTSITSGASAVITPVVEMVVAPVAAIVSNVVGGAGVGGTLPVVGSLPVVASLPVVSATGGVVAGAGGNVTVTPAPAGQGVVGSLLGGLGIGR